MRFQVYFSLQSSDINIPLARFTCIANRFKEVDAQLQQALEAFGPVKIEILNWVAK